MVENFAKQYSLLMVYVNTGVRRYSKPFAARKGSGFWRGLAFIAALAVLLICRRPDAIFRANFWAEDSVWYSDAYSQGWVSLFLPHTGYLQMAPRLVALVAQGVPLVWAPTVFSGFALFFQLLPPAVLLSSNLNNTSVGVGARFLLALLYIVLPNSGEVLLNLTNSQWHLAIAALLLILSAAPVNIWGRTAQVALLVVAGLSGPFSIALGFVLLLRRFLTCSTIKGVMPRAHYLPVALAAGVQICTLVSTQAAGRSSATLGVNIEALIQILAMQVFLGALIGTRLLYHIQVSRLWQIVLSVFVVGGAAYLISRAVKLRPVAFGCALLFATLILSAALVSPQVSLSEPQWHVLSHPGAGNRYFFIPMVVWISALVTLLGDRSRSTRLTVTVLLGIVLFGAAADWKRGWSQSKTNFVAEARAFDLAPLGTSASFDVLPPGFAPMYLTKR